MKIRTITSYNSMGKDFDAIMECENCGHIGVMYDGCQDDFFHRQVMPSIICKECNQNRDGNTENREGVNGKMII